MAFIYDLTDTWNAGGTTFSAIKMNVTDTASASASKLVQCQISGTDKFTVGKDGGGYFAGNLGVGTSSPSGKLHIAESAPNTDVYIYMSGNGTYSSRMNFAGANTFLEAANNFRFTVGGSERMRIDSSGRVGVGTSSPAYPLDVSGNAQIGIRYTDTVATNSARMYLTCGTATGALQQYGSSHAAAPNALRLDSFAGPLQLATLNTERMRIDSSGRQLINTTAAYGNAKLQVRTDANDEGLLFDLNDTTSGNYTTIGLNGSTANLGAEARTAEIRLIREGTAASGAIAFRTRSTSSVNAEHMRIASNGNVGIGSNASNPGYELDVRHTTGTVTQRIRTDAADTAALRLENSGGVMLIQHSGAGNASIFNYQGGLFIDNPNGGIQVRDSDGGYTTSFLINSTANSYYNGTGNFGIGTPSPNTKLTVEGSACEVAINDSAGSIAGLRFRTSGSTKGVIQADSTSNLRFSSGATERMRIDSSGRVGIGTTSPQNRLELSGGGLTVTSSGSPALTTNTAGVHIFGNPGPAGGFRLGYGWNVGFNGANWVTGGDTTNNGGAMITANYGAGTLEFYTVPRTGGASQTITDATMATYRRMVLDASGNVGIGTSSPSYQLQLSTDSAAKPSTNTWTIASDARIKKETGEYTKGLDAVCSLRPVTYEYNGAAGFEADGKENISIIAQEAIEHFPECVGRFNAKLNDDDVEETELLNWNGHALTFALVNAVKELKAQNDELSARVAQLEG